MTAASDPTALPVGHLTDALLDQWHRVAAGVTSISDWEVSTRLQGWTAGTLLAHLVLVAEAISRTLGEAPTAAEPVSVYDVFRSAPSRAADNDRRARACAASTSSHELVARLDEAVVAARGVAAGVDPTVVLPTRFGALPVGDFLTHRIVEGVVHGMDLPQPAAPGESALAVASAAMVTLLRQTHSDLVTYVPGDRVVWLDAATGRAPAPPPLAAALPLLA